MNCLFFFVTVLCSEQIRPVSHFYQNLLYSGTADWDDEPDKRYQHFLGHICDCSNRTTVSKSRGLCRNMIQNTHLTQMEAFSIFLVDWLSYTFLEIWFINSVTWNYVSGFFIPLLGSETLTIPKSFWLITF